MLEWLQSSWLAHAIGESQMLTASLSSLHLLGFTLVMGSALISTLRMLGVLFPERPATDVTRPTSRALAVGLVISVITGSLLFVPRAEGAASNTTFQIKLTLLVVAALVHFVAQARVARGGDEARGRARVTGAIGLALWLGVALAGCAFILFE